MRGDSVARRCERALRLARLAREHDLPLWRAYGAFFEGLATAERGALGEGLEDMRRGAELLREQNVLNFDGLFKIALAEAEARAGDRDRAIATLDEALATCRATGYRAFEAELHRARGEMLLECDPAKPAPAEEAFQTAIAVAKRQGTRSFELRAALSLAKLYQLTARPVDAHAVLAPALEGFAPTPEMPEIAEAQALLAALARADEVKTARGIAPAAAPACRTAYGQAIITPRGFAADETKTALCARPRSSRRREGDATERFGGRLRAVGRQLFARRTQPVAGRMRRAFLRDTEDEGRMTEAGVAHRVPGITACSQGEFHRRAATISSEALRIYDPERDATTKFRFGVGHWRCRAMPTSRWRSVASGRGRTRAVRS